ncbi:MAG: hypothetical protein U9Q07_02840 [Planctomycetota bacterium]|nr:hypothetical protein [Planctomycetota bacterium]
MREIKLSLMIVCVAVCTHVLVQDSQGRDEQGWRAKRELSDAATRRRPEFIYYEEKVPDYTLPELLVTADRTPVTTAQMWRTGRRTEILELFRTHVYGRSPGRPERQTFKVVKVDTQALNGQATLKRVQVTIGGPKGQLSTTMSIFLPNSAKKPVPLFLLLSHRDPDSTDWTRKIKRPFWSAEQIIARGYGTAAIQVTDFAPDRRDGWKHGVHTIFDDPGESSGDGWGTLAAWAWTGSRALDYFETDDDIDSTQVAVVGQSRGGKTALWAGARDERFAMAVSNCSGCGGAALSRRRFGETVERINANFPHWFCDNFNKYGNAEDKLPVDQHMLIALMAPRLAYVASAEDDLWADPKGEFLAAKHAGEVYRLFGLKGLDVQSIPPVESPVHTGRIGHHIHAGKHDLIEYDWQHFMDFADKHFKRNDIVFSCDFESDNWFEQFGMRKSPTRVDAVSSDPARKFEPLAGKAIRIKVDRGGHYGASIIYRFKDQIGAEPEEIYFRYYLRFADDWDPQGGGKLPGISGTYNLAGWGGRPSNGRNGWSARGLFKKQSDGKTPVGYYCYHADMRGRYGSGWTWEQEKRGYLANNRWYCIEQYAKMNTPGNNDGILRAWVDGKPAFEKTDIRMRDVDTLKIEAVWLNVYLGGTWTARSNHHLYIDNVAIARNYIGPMK